MSQNIVERTIGKLVTDEEFRLRFFANPAAATWLAGLPLAPVELEALSALSQAAVTRFSESLDPRIRRLCPAQPERRRPLHVSGEPSDTGTESGT